MTEKLLELNPEVKNDILEFEILMEHHHFRGKRVKPHCCWITIQWTLPTKICPKTME